VLVRIEHVYDDQSRFRHEKELPRRMGASTLIDTLLDRSIALGYSDIGPLVRRRLPGWPADPPRMDGQVAAVTGAASGIGLASAIGFARLGASVLAVVRSQERAAQAEADVRAAVPGADVRGVVCDLSSLDSVRAFAQGLEPRLDVLVNNAGVMPPERSYSADGVELMFATHVLAPWVLVDQLRPLPARVITVSSGGMYSQALPFGDPQSERTEYSPQKLYARTKRQQVVLTELWAERLRGGVFHSMHPGWVDTKGIRDALPGFSRLVAPVIRDAEAGADTVVWLGAAPEALASSGRFWHDRRQRPTHYRLGAGEDPPAAREELWRECERLA
jgi:NAD(P)-dependent dehydrogenase (short-subunit alcohol dehydrogenase family)